LSIDENSRVYDDDVPKQAREAYDELANWYSARKKGSYEFKVLLPAILNLLDNLRGKRLIDIGCGPCAYSTEFARKGAEVYGVDISQKMLEKAKDNADVGSVRLELQKADMHLLPYKDGFFDIAVLTLTILNTKIVQEASRVLKPNGLFLYADTHPIVEARGRRWENDKIGAPLIIEDYFSRDKREWRIEHALEQKIILKYYTRTIEQCTNMLADASFKILRIAEPKPRSDLMESDPTHYDRCSRIPYFIVYLAQKNA
jgi:ubiquinone/menaquinone biosynthesis C-methylase UbiE